MEKRSQMLIMPLFYNCSFPYDQPRETTPFPSGKIYLRQRQD